MYIIVLDRAYVPKGHGVPVRFIGPFTSDQTIVWFRANAEALDAAGVQHVETEYLFNPEGE